MILERIRQIYPQLTKNQKRLADYVIASYQEVAFMTASRLARTLAVNEATVIRFAQRLGYAGFPQLIQDVQEVVREELRAKAEAQRRAIGESPLLGALEGEIELLRRAGSHISPELADEVQRLVRQAERIVVLGQGLAAPLAELLALALRGLGLSAESPPADVLGLALALDDAAEGVLYIGIAAGSESTEVANALKVAGQRGARTIALSQSPVSPTAQAADLALGAASADILPLPSCAFVAVVSDALVQSLAAGDGDAARVLSARRAETLEKLLARRAR